MKKLIKRWLIIAGGTAVTVIGLILIPVPGPGGTPVTLAGLAILGSEIPWARRLMLKLKDRVTHLKSEKTTGWKRIGIVAGIIAFYVVTSVLITKIWTG